MSISRLIIKEDGSKIFECSPIKYQADYGVSSAVEVLTDGSIVNLVTGGRVTFINIYVDFDFLSDIMKNKLLEIMNESSSDYGKPPSIILYDCKDRPFSVYLDDIDWSYLILPKTVYNSMIPCKVVCKFTGNIPNPIA